MAQPADDLHPADHRALDLAALEKAVLVHSCRLGVDPRDALRDVLEKYGHIPLRAIGTCSRRMRAELEIETDEAEQADRRRELDEEVDVAAGVQLAAGCRAKDGSTSDAAAREARPGSASNLGDGRGCCRRVAVEGTGLLGSGF